MKTKTHILNNISANKKMLAVLLDPDKCKHTECLELLEMMEQYPPDFIFVGGSRVSHSVEQIVAQLKATTTIPVLLFPGDVSQFTPKADALLYLSLLSGRNAEYLIGQHVRSSIEIKASGIECIPTAYLLIDGAKTSAVEYVSNTRPIPSDEHELVVATALAGELLGMQMLYLEAGSGAHKTVPKEVIATVRQAITLPLIVGGGIKSAETLTQIYHAGANIAVVGNALETHPHLLAQLVTVRNEVNKG